MFPLIVTFWHCILQLHIVSGFVRLLDFLESPVIVLTSGKLLRNLNEISELLKSLVFSFYVLNVLLSSGHKSTRVSFDHQLSCTLTDSKDSHKLWTCSKFRWELMRVQTLSLSFDHQLSCILTDSQALSSALNLFKISMRVQTLSRLTTSSHALSLTLKHSHQLWTCSEFWWQFKLSLVWPPTLMHSHRLSSALINFGRVQNFNESCWEFKPPTRIQSKFWTLTSVSTARPLRSTMKSDSIPSAGRGELWGWTRLKRKSAKTCCCLVGATQMCSLPRTRWNLLQFTYTCTDAFF